MRIQLPDHKVFYNFRFPVELQLPPFSLHPPHVHLTCTGTHMRTRTHTYVEARWQQTNPPVYMWCCAPVSAVKVTISSGRACVRRVYVRMPASTRTSVVGWPRVTCRRNTHARTPKFNDARQTVTKLNNQYCCNGSSVCQTIASTNRLKCVLQYKI